MRYTIEEIRQMSEEQTFDCKGKHPFIVNIPLSALTES